MRFSYLVPRAIILSILWGFFTFAFDPLLRRAVVTTGQTVAGAKVDVTALRTSLPSLSLSMNGVQVANRSVPDANLLQFDTLRIRLSGPALLRRSLLIEEGSLTGLQWETRRNTPGRLEQDRRSKSRAPNRFGTLLDGMSRTGTDWLAGLAQQTKQKLDPQRLESVRLTSRLQKKWDQRFQELESRIKKLETRVKRIERDVRRARGNTLERFAVYQRAATETDQVLAESERIRREIARLPAEARSDFRSINDARRRDQEALQQTLQTLRPDADSLSKSLLGPELTARLSQVARWITSVREAAARVENRPRPQRLRGTDILFSQREPLPTFLIRRLHIAGTAKLNGESMPFQGTVTGITSDPTLYGRPVVVRLSGGGRQQMQAVAVLDHTHPIPVYRLEVTVTDSKPVRIRLGNSQTVALTLNADRSVYQARLALTGDRLEGDISLRQQDVRLTADTTTTAGRDELLRAVRSAVSGIKTVDASLRLIGTLERPRWTVRSTLGPQLARGMNQALSTELAVRQRQLSEQVDRIARRRSDALAKTLNSRYADLTSKLKQNEDLARNTVRKLTGGRALKIDRLFR